MLCTESDIHALSAFGNGKDNIGMTVAVLYCDIIHLKSGENARVAARPLGGSYLCLRLTRRIGIIDDILSDIGVFAGNNVTVVYGGVLNVYLRTVLVVEMRKNVCVAVICTAAGHIACKVKRKAVLLAGSKSRYAVGAFGSARFGVGLIVGVLVVFVGYNVVVLIEADRIVRRGGVFVLRPRGGKEKVIEAYFIHGICPLRDKRIGFTLEGVEITAVYIRLVGVNSRYRTVYKSAPTRKFIAVANRLGNKHCGFGSLTVTEPCVAV